MDDQIVGLVQLLNETAFPWNVNNEFFLSWKVNTVFSLWAFHVSALVMAVRCQNLLPWYLCSEHSLRQGERKLFPSTPKQTQLVISKSSGISKIWKIHDFDWCSASWLCGHILYKIYDITSYCVCCHTVYLVSAQKWLCKISDMGIKKKNIKILQFFCVLDICIITLFVFQFNLSFLERS